MIKTFASHKSKSVQETLYEMGKSALERVAEVDQIDLTMPNKHCLLVDLARFGQDNPKRDFRSHGRTRGPHPGAREAQGLSLFPRTRAKGIRLKLIFIYGRPASICKTHRSSRACSAMTGYRAFS